MVGTVERAPHKSLLNSGFRLQSRQALVLSLSSSHNPYVSLIPARTRSKLRKSLIAGYLKRR